MSSQLVLFDIAPLRDPGPWCVDCNVDSCAVDGLYMVHDRVWPIGRLDGMLCVACLEQRIGRRLTPADFQDVPCNRWPHTHSRRLMSRTGHWREDLDAYLAGGGPA
jgi:hypothetical protein